MSDHVVHQTASAPEYELNQTEHSVGSSGARFSRSSTGSSLLRQSSVRSLQSLSSTSADMVVPAELNTRGIRPHPDGQMMRKEASARNLRQDSSFRRPKKFVGGDSRAMTRGRSMRDIMMQRESSSRSLRSESMAGEATSKSLVRGSSNRSLMSKEQNEMPKEEYTRDDHEWNQGLSQVSRPHSRKTTTNIVWDKRPKPASTGMQRELSSRSLLSRESSVRSMLSRESSVRSLKTTDSTIQEEPTMYGEDTTNSFHSSNSQSPAQGPHPPLSVHLRRAGSGRSLEGDFVDACSLSEVSRPNDTSCDYMSHGGAAHKTLSSSSDHNSTRYGNHRDDVSLQGSSQHRRNLAREELMWRNAASARSGRSTAPALSDFLDHNTREQHHFQNGVERQRSSRAISDHGHRYAHNNQSHLVRQSSSRSLSSNGCSRHQSAQGHAHLSHHSGGRGGSSHDARGPPHTHGHSPVHHRSAHQQRGLSPVRNYEGSQRGGHSNTQFHQPQHGRDHSPGRGYAANSGYPREDSNDGSRSASEATIEISPGVYGTLRSAAETWDCIKSDAYVTCACIVCSTDICCIQGAEYVLCPLCKVVSPLDRQPRFPGVPFKGGVGLGFTLEDLFKWQCEIYEQEQGQQVPQRQREPAYA